MNIPTSKYKIIKAKIFLIALYTSLYSANFTEQIILATGKNPHFIQTDFRYPGANSKIKVSDYYFETFQWKVASNKSDKIHVKINQKLVVGEFYNIKVTEAFEYDVIGEVVD